VSSYFRQLGQPSLVDLKSGFLVFLIALPLCLGISIASGFPPAAGILTAIIGGMLSTFTGGAKLTIKGPAAGLIVIAIGSVMELGQGDMQLGYERTLAVGVAAAIIQIVFSFIRAATLGVIMSPSVVHGMLAAIGVIIIAKQSYVMMGVKPVSKEPLELLAQIPQNIGHSNPYVLLLGIISLVILFMLPRLPWKALKALPAQIWVLLVTIPIALAMNIQSQHDYLFANQQYHLGPEYLVQLPASLLNIFTFPDFSHLLTAASIKYIIMFALIGTIESTLSALAVDSMDPNKGSTHLNKDLFATGLGNLLSSLLGGLPMISEIVRSKANIDAGAQSRWSNFFHGAFLLLFVALIPSLLNQIPLAVLAAMLVFTGARLASFSQLLHIKKIGVDQLVLFSSTLFVTLATDLLVGVGVGILLKLALHLLRGVPFKSIFYPKIQSHIKQRDLYITIESAATFSSILPLRRTIQQGCHLVDNVIINFSNSNLIDHTFLSYLDTLRQEWPALNFRLEGLGELRSLSQHPHATKVKVYS